MTAHHGTRNETMMVRMAAEGVPVSAIARIACVSPSLAKVTLNQAIESGHLASLPAAEWPNAQVPERTATALPIEQIHSLADSLRLSGKFKIGPAESRLAATLALTGLLSNPDARVIVCGSIHSDPKTIDVHLCKLRKKLKPHRIFIATLRGRGHLMDEASRERLLAVVGRGGRLMLPETAEFPRNLVVIDLAPHPEISFAVIVHGQLLPMRFAKETEAAEHLRAMLTQPSKMHARTAA